MKKVLVILLIAFVIIQFFRIDKTNPAPTPQMDFLTTKSTPESTAKLIRNGCYDCHSNETKYPWYSNVQPVGFFMEHHIKEAKEDLNFDEWGKYSKRKQENKLDRIVKQIKSDEMPLASYTLIHKNARLTTVQKEEIMDWLSKIKDSISSQY